MTNAPIAARTSKTRSANLSLALRCESKLSISYLLKKLYYEPNKKAMTRLVTIGPTTCTQVTPVFLAA